MDIIPKLCPKILIKQSLSVLLVLTLSKSQYTCTATSTFSTKNSALKCNDCCRGPTGQAGVPGVHGLHGHPGAAGKKGDKGDQGDMGHRGTPGANGAIGPTGRQGLRGRKGRKGECGPKGIFGSPGIKGDRGFMGFKGHKGEKGEHGERAPLIAFSAGRSMKLGKVLQDTIVTYDKVFSNSGNSFDEYTSTFICRRNGTYFFTVHILGQNKLDAVAWIMLNKKHMVPLHGDGRAGHGTGSNSVILHLEEDDHVWIQLMNESALLNDYSTFTGFLLHEDD